jgi:predicted ATP-dependent endonuclease of OLD family
MKLNSLIIKNFRGYRDIKIPFNENLNLIIGRNDVGKSTILDALEIFFNNDKVKMEVSDLNIDAVSDDKFEVLDGQQRITSLGRFVTGKFAIKNENGMPQTYGGLAADKKEKEFEVVDDDE